MCSSSIYRLTPVDSHPFSAAHLGRRLTSNAHRRDDVAADTLQVPLYILEDFVRQRVSATIQHSFWRASWLIVSRASLMCGALHFLKLGIKRLVTRVQKPRLQAGVYFVLDVLFPTEFFGPLMGLALLSQRVLKELKTA